MKFTDSEFSRRLLECKYTMRETRDQNFRRCICRSPPPRRAAISKQTLSFPFCGKGAKRSSQGSVRTCPEAVPLAAGLGDAASPQKGKNLAEPFPVQPGAWYVRRSIFVRHHNCDGGFWLVHVEGAASGNQFDEARGAVVVSDIERKRQAGLSGLRF